MTQDATFTDSSPRFVFTTSPTAPTQSPRLIPTKPSKSSVTRGEGEQLHLVPAPVAQRREGELALGPVQHDPARDADLDAGLLPGFEPVVLRARSAAVVAVVSNRYGTVLTSTRRSSRR